MRTMICGLGLAIACGSAARAQAPASAMTPGTAALRDSIIAIEKQSWDAWTKRDGGFFARFLSDDHVEVGAGGVVGKAEVVAFVGSPACVVKSYDGTNFKFTQLDVNTVVLTYKVAQTTTCGGNAVPSPAWTTSLFVRRGGKWLNALYQQTPTATR